MGVGDKRDSSGGGRMRGEGPVADVRGNRVAICWSVGPDGAWWNLVRRIRWSRIGTLVR